MNREQALTNSAFVSYAGATSTMSAETIWRPSKPLRMVRSSRVDQPPVSGVPVAGAKAGSRESIYPQCEPKKKTKRLLYGLTDIDRKVDGEVPDCIADFLNDAIRTYKRSELYDAASEERNGGVPIESISRASILLKPD